MRESLQLTELELSILSALNQGRRATVEQIRRELSWPDGGLSIRLALLHLEEKACVSHFIEKGQIFYRSSVPRFRHGMVAAEST